MTSPDADKRRLSDSALLYAFDVDAQGRATRLNADQMSLETPAEAAYRWAHMGFSAPELAPWLAERLDDVVAASLTAPDTRPRCALHKNGAVLILRGVNLNPDADPEDMVSVRMWITERLVISVRIRRLLAVVRLRERVEAHDGPPNVSTFFAMLAGGLTAKMDPVIMNMAERVDDLEAEHFERTAQAHGELADLRRKTIILRRYVAPQREALNTLSTLHGLVEEGARVSLRETVDRVTRMVEELDAIRDRCANLNDQLTDQRAEAMNKQLMVLSVVAAIFLPLGFLTGLLGVNVGGIPGASAPWAFAALCIMLVLMAGLLLWWFRRRGWL